jgi:hypothetical protein
MDMIVGGIIYAEKKRGVHKSERFVDVLKPRKLTRKKIVYEDKDIFKRFNF